MELVGRLQGLQGKQSSIYTIVAPVQAFVPSGSSLSDSLANRNVSFCTPQSVSGGFLLEGFSLVSTATKQLHQRSSNEGLARRRKGVVRAITPGAAEQGTSSSSQPSSDVLGPAAQAHLDLLERFTSRNSFLDSGKEGKTIGEQLSSQYEVEGQEVSVPLGTLEKSSSNQEPLTISQKRNIRRQDYLNKVANRNDAPLFATIAAAVLLPPFCILGIAVASGYIDLLP